jgi:cytochrome c peroxidase
VRGRSAFSALLARRGRAGALGLGVLAALGAAWYSAAALALPWWGPSWSAQDRAVLASLEVDRLAPPAAIPGIAPAQALHAAQLGKRLFADPRLSRDGSVSCASCHDPGRGFQDGRELGHGLGIGARRTMPVAGAGTQAFLMWDGRKDSLWSQALGPLENPREHGGTRLAYVHVLHDHYQAAYEQVFGPLPDLAGLPARAGPAGDPAERAAWQQLPKARQQAVSQAFANLGKAIAAYEDTVRFAPAPIDRFIATLGRDPDAAAPLLPASAQRGLRIFLHEGRCVTCHGGPLFSDGQFHNTGVPPRLAVPPDPGRAAGIAQLTADEFNCLGPYSGVPAAQCDELRFLAVADPHALGAFKTPSLRNAALRPPYMHAGQLASLDAVVRHYARAPAAAVGTTELKPVTLSDEQVKDVVAFLGTLSGPLVEVAPRAPP